MDIRNYFNKHCKVILSGGRQVYGVLLQGEVYDSDDDLYFLSFGQLQRLANDRKRIYESAYRIKTHDVVRAEIIDDKAGAKISMAA